MANFSSPNPHIDLAGSAFRIETRLTPWPQSQVPRRAGVSSFGVGGTNVHLVLEEAPAIPQPAAAADAVHILPLSAKTPAALEAQARAMAEHLQDYPQTALSDIAFTLAEGRTAREERGAVVAATSAEACEKLGSFAKQAIRGTVGKSEPVVFMFPGQGSQYPAMGRSLYRSQPVFSQWIDRGAEILQVSLGTDIRKVLYDDASVNSDGDHPIRSTIFAQPALFLTQFGLAQLWSSLDVRPDAMIGHSVGELVAATLAGVMSFEDALALVAGRARLMMNAPRGAMLAVATGQDQLAELIGPAVDIAAINAPKSCVAAGPFDAIDELEARLADAGIDCTRLHTSHAFHSAMMDGVVSELETLASRMTFREPELPYVSCVTGDWARGATAADGRYWARH
jgi:acyl transferase domain-containing protein